MPDESGRPPRRRPAPSLPPSPPIDVSERRAPPDTVLAPDEGETLEAGASPPDRDDDETPAELTQTARAISGPMGRSVALTILAVLAVLYTLFFARDFLRPIAFAILLDFLFSPVVRALNRVGVRPPFGAAVVVLSLIAILSFGVYELAGPVQGWAARVPTTVSAARSKLRSVLQPIEKVTKTAEQVEQVTSNVSGATKKPEVVVRGPSLMSRVFGTTQRFAAGLLEVLVLLYFLLAVGDLFLQKMVKVLPQLEDKRAAIEIARESESSISTYLLTALAVNIGEAIVVTLAMWLLGMPNPPLWGALVILLEFIPYIGAATMILVLTLAGLTTFGNVGHALLVPASFLAINLIQANLVNPMLFGRRLTLNPVAIFVGLAFWWWIWGIAGAFLAVPMLATFKIICDHATPLASIGEFLGQRDETERRATVRE